MAKKTVSKTKEGAFAVIATGGKQYKVTTDQTITIEKIKGVKAGDKVSFDQVLLKSEGASVSVGTPLVSGAKVEAEAIELGRSAKVIVMKYKPKSRYHKKNGHRQEFLKVKITSI